MEKISNKYIAVTYKLHAIDANGTSTMVEEATANRPFVFVSGFGTTLDAFEQAVETLEKGAAFDFEIGKDDAYGDHMDERVVSLDKDIFTINGRFDSDNIYKDAIVPLQNEDGQRFMGLVLAITEDKVKLDLNHPLAGKALHFAGTVIENREATNEEIQKMISLLSGEGCGHCGGNCEGGCGGHGEEGGCGKHNGDGGCCGKCK